MAEVRIFTHGEAITSHHGNLGAAATYGPVVEQIRPFPSLPPRLMFAALERTSNKTLAHVQL
ncbi:unnamed protein product [Prunus armeniaca]